MNGIVVWLIVFTPVMALVSGALQVGWLYSRCVPLRTASAVLRVAFSALIAVAVVMRPGGWLAALFMALAGAMTGGPVTILLIADLTRQPYTAVLERLRGHSPGDEPQ